MQYTVTKRIKRLSETLDMVYLVNVENIMVNVNQKKTNTFCITFKFASDKFCQ